jgi:hypothetical protein
VRWSTKINGVDIGTGILSEMTLWRKEWFPQLSDGWYKNKFIKSSTCALCGHPHSVAAYFCNEPECPYGSCMQCYTQAVSETDREKTLWGTEHTLPPPTGMTCADSIPHRPIAGQVDASFLVRPFIHFHMAGKDTTVTDVVPQKRKKRKTQEGEEAEAEEEESPPPGAGQRTYTAPWKSAVTHAVFNRDHRINAGYGAYPMHMSIGQESLETTHKRLTDQKYLKVLEKTRCEVLILSLSGHTNIVESNGYMLGDSKDHSDAVTMLHKIILPIVTAHRELEANRNSSVVVFFNYCSTKKGTWQHLLDTEVSEKHRFDLFLFEKPLTLESTPPMLSSFISQWCDQMNFRRHGKEWDVPHAFAKSVSPQSLAEHQPVLCRKGEKIITNFLPYMQAVCTQMETTPTRLATEKISFWDSRKRNLAVEAYLIDLFGATDETGREAEKTLFTAVDFRTLTIHLNDLCGRLAREKGAKIASPIADGKTNSASYKWLQQRWEVNSSDRMWTWTGVRVRTKKEKLADGTLAHRSVQNGDNKAT